MLGYWFVNLKREMEMLMWCEIEISSVDREGLSYKYN